MPPSVVWHLFHEPGLLEGQSDFSGRILFGPVASFQLVDRVPYDHKRHGSFVWLTSIIHRRQRRTRVRISEPANLLISVEPEVCEKTSARHFGGMHDTAESNEGLFDRQNSRNRASVRCIWTPPGT